MSIKIEFSTNAMVAIRRFELCSKWIDSTVQDPDDLHKIIYHGAEGKNWPVVSLYIRRFLVKKEPFLILVQALKQGQMVTITAVWQIYTCDIGVGESASALDVFEAFIEKYAVWSKTAHGLTKLVLHQVVASSTTTKKGKWIRTFTLPESVLNEEDHRVTAKPEICLQKWAKQLDIKMRIAILYSVNISNYLHDLACHDKTNIMASQCA